MNGILRNMASVYLADKNNLLMLYRIGSRVVAPSWCGIGGHFEPGELNDAKSCVLRELQEEMGLTQGDITNLELRYITMRLKAGEVRQNYYFFADLKEGTEVPFTCDEGTPAWVPFEKVNELEMPFAAQAVLRHYLLVGRHDDLLYAGSATVNGVVFSQLTEF